MVALHKTIPLTDKEEWENALKGIDHTFGHTWENCYAMHLTTGEKTFLYCYEKKQVRIVCPIVERKFKGYVDIAKPIGFSGFVGTQMRGEFYEDWMSFVKERSYISGFLGINPVFDFSRLFKKEEVYSHKKVYLLDIEPSLPEIYRRMSKGRREQCRRYERNKHDIIIENQKILKDFFIKEYKNFLRRKGSSPSKGLQESTLNYLIELDNVVLIGASQSDQVVAVSLIASAAGNGEYLLHVSLPEGAQFSAPIICHGIPYFKAIGVKNINLGGDTTPGIGDFKKRFGSFEIPLKCLKQVYRPDIYQQLCHDVQADHQDFSGFFPVYRKSASFFS